MKAMNEDYIRLEMAYKTILGLEQKIESFQKGNVAEPVAVVGIGCKFPGKVGSPDEFYQLLKEGKSVIEDIPVERWNFDKCDRKIKEKIYCRKGGFLSDLFEFDPLFFNISPLEAEYMDPQQRIFLETCWKAFEDAGYTTDKLYDLRCGVFAGIVSNDYYGYLNSIPHKTEAYELTGNYSSILSARISYFLNLKGPAITIDTACSSSGVAIHLACKSIQNGDSDIALAGGVTLYTTLQPWLLMNEASMVSRTGQCYTFDDRADGFLPGEGCGVVVLKSLKKAIQDGNHIYGVIRGSGVNQDGKSNGITAPNALAQTELQLKVLSEYNVNPEDISYIEAHGTGTVLGDPIEIEALTNTFRKYTQKNQFCAIGSVKTNIGHLEAASGVASLIKVLLGMQNNCLLPSLNYQKANRHIQIDETPFFVNTNLKEWKGTNSGEKIAAINSFGFSGTNVCLIVENYRQEKSNNTHFGPYLIPLSANSKGALRKYADELKRFVISHQQNNDDITGEVRQQVHEYIASILCISSHEVDENVDWDLLGLETISIQQLIKNISIGMKVSLNITDFVNLRNVNQLVEYLADILPAKDDESFMADFAYTMQTGRNTMKNKQLFIASSQKDLVEQLDLFLQGKILQQSVALSKEAQLCKQKWESGEPVEWSTLYNDGNPNLISGPTYPFDKKEYILKPSDENEEYNRLQKLGSESYYLYEFSEDFNSANSHKVKNNEILPATFFIELMIQMAARKLGRGINCLQDVCFKNPLFIVKDDTKVNLVLRNNKKDWEIECKALNSGYQSECIYSTGKLLIKEFSPKNALAMNFGSISKSFDKNEWYKFASQKGFLYGKKYQTIEHVNIYDEEAEAVVSLSSADDKYCLSPYSLDGAIQPVIALIDAMFPNHTMFVPYQIESLSIYHPLTEKMTSYVKKSKISRLTSSNSWCYHIDVYIMDQNGRLLLEISNMSINVIEHSEISIDNTVLKETVLKDSVLKETVQEAPAYVMDAGITETVEANHVQTEGEQGLAGVEAYLIKAISELLKIPYEDIDTGNSFPSYGIDSFTSLKLIRVLENKMGKLPQTILFEHFNIDKLSRYLYDNFAEKFKPSAPVEKKEYRTVSMDTSINTKAVIRPIATKPTIIHEANMESYPEKKEHIERIIKQYEMEGLAFARKEMAPLIFLGSKKESFFYVTEKDNFVLALLYTGPVEALTELCEEFADYYSKKNKNIYFMIEQELDHIKGRKLGYTVMGALQRLKELPADLSGKKYRHLRYAISNFQKAGECHVQEYRINSNPQTDSKILALIDQWCNMKKMVNPYIQKVKSQILAGSFSKIYRFFLTYLNNELVDVIVITPIPACNGYLMDLEFYPSDMPLGGLEYSISKVYEQLSSEGINFFSLGATFGIGAENKVNTDPVYSESLSELWMQGIFDGKGNYQFKNKFRTENHPLNLYRLMDSSPDSLIDIIMCIANPDGAESLLPSSLAVEAEEVVKDGGKEYPSNTTYEQLAPFHYNTLFLPAQKIKHDLLTDSWSELAGSSFQANIKHETVECNDYDLIHCLQAAFPFTYIIPVSSGRYAESLLFQALPKGKDVVAQNLLFPTTANNLIQNGYRPLEIPVQDIYSLRSQEIYRGNIDTDKLAVSLESGNTAYVVVEVGNNASGGSAVSIQNLSDTHRLCSKYQVPLIVDATRVIENVLFIAEQGNTHKSPLQLTEEMLSCADYVVASLTKDFGTPVGGIIATNNIEVYQKISQLLSLQGSGLNILDKQIIYKAVSDKEKIVVEASKRKQLVTKLGTGIKDVVPVVTPFGGHCLLIDVSKIDGLQNFDYPAQAFLNWLYEETGIRAGIHSGGLDKSNSLNKLIRLAVPVGCQEKEIDEIIIKTLAACQRKKFFMDLSVVQKGDSSFGTAKNKYQIRLSSPKNSQLPVKTAGIGQNEPLDVDDPSLVAIVGVSGLYPDAENLYEFWNNLISKKDSVREIPKERWDYNLFYDSDRMAHGKNPSKWGAFIKDIDKFDPQFFQITPYEAEKMDPQQRLFLQTAWKVIEDAGYALSDFHEQTGKNVGVFVGATWSEYGYLADAEKGFYPEVNLGSIATRVSYHLDFKGPSMAVDTHCSSSLSALYLAYEAVKTNACKAAIAGGVNLSIHPNKYQLLKYFLSPTGKCHSFGAAGDGYVPGEGTGAVLLKPLNEAIKSNDHIYGVIRGAVMKHGGKTAGATVPNPRSQAEVIMETYKLANINPETISYVESHGTGTDLGDPIEIEGLTTAFSQYTDKKQFCAIGAVKSNIGHLEAAAGISQLTKVLLQLKYKKLVPSLHSETLNSKIDFEQTPFYVQRELTDWEHPQTAAYPRRSAISAFGAGGVNCHCVIEEFPNEYPSDYSSPGQRLLFPVSAKSRNALMEYVKAFSEFLKYEGKVVPLQNIAYTLQIGREAFKKRVVFAASSSDELIELCSRYINGQTSDKIFTGNQQDLDKSKNTRPDTVTSVNAVNIEEMANYWVNGGSIDWRGVYNYKQIKRVSLPTYPFEKERYWAPCGETGITAKNLFISSANEHTQNNCIQDEDNDRLVCYKKVYQPTEGIVAERVKDQIIIFDTDESFFNYLSDKGYSPILVKPGTGFSVTAANSFTVSPNEKHQFEVMWAQLLGENSSTGVTLLYLWSNIVADKSWEEYTCGLMMPFLNLCSTLNKYALKQQFNIICGFVASNGQADLFNSSIASFFKTVNLENHNLRAKVVSTDNRATFYENISCEMGSLNDNVEHVMYRQNERLAICYEALQKDNTLKDTVLRTKGTYVITGGMGGVGYHIGQYLASCKQANLSLIGRSPMNQSISEKIQKLEKQGASVLYIQADISKKEDVKKAVEQTRKAFGSISGIIHGAGIVQDAYLINKNMDEFMKVAAPKILGTVYLDECTCGEPLDFFAMFSSIASVCGNIGQCDYSYANSFIDHYAQYREDMRKAGYRSGYSTSINWPLWEEGGMQIPDIKKEIIYDQTGLESLNTSDGIQALLQAVSSGATQVVVAVGDQEKIQKLLLNDSMAKALPCLDQQDAKVDDSVSEDNYERVCKLLIELVAEGAKLPLHKMNIQTRFEEYGLDSVMIEQLIFKLEKHFGKLSSTLLFQYESIAELADYLVNNQQEAVRKYVQSKTKPIPTPIAIAKESVNVPLTQVVLKDKEESKCEDIAIVGVSGVYPKARNIEEFWSNLEQGVDCVTEVPIDRWDWRQYYDERQENAYKGKIYCKWGGFIDDVDYFDPILFNISPKEAETMDPQERLFLQNVWELLERSGNTRESLSKRYPKENGADVGVFVGVTTNTYQLLGHEQWDKNNYIVPTSIPWSIPNRVSFFFNFHGPSIAVDTACSSSLVAIHMACESLRNNECTLAIAGGVNLYFHPSKYLAMCQMGMVSPKGKCHSFGIDADGFVPAEGIGSVLLKPLSLAIKDGDEIWGVIKGTSINHGGRTNGYKVPNPHSHAMLIKKALENAKLNPSDINYIEAHGTGTSLGDPIEIDGLIQAFEGYATKKQICPIGSVKSNIGHAESAAGIASLTKVLLQMKHRTLVPSLHSQQLNKHIDFENTPFYVQREVSAWSPENPDSLLRAGISSFGAGGVNAHVIVEEYKNGGNQLKKPLYVQASSEGQRELLFIFSTKNKESLDELLDKYLELLLVEKINLKSLSYTLQTTREEMEERAAFVADSQDLLIKGIRDYLNGITNDSFIYTGNKNDSNQLSQDIDPKNRKEWIKKLVSDRDFHKIASLWVTGEVFDWSLCHDGMESRKLSLPTYPLAKKSCWVYEKEQQPVVYLAQGWLEDTLKEEAGSESSIMLVGTRSVDHCLQTIEQNHLGRNIVKVYLGERNAKIDPNVFEVNIAQGLPDFSIVESGKEIDTIYFLGGLSQEDNAVLKYSTYQQRQNEGALALIALLKSFNRNITIKVITNQCFIVDATESTKCNLFSTALTGLCKTIPMEYNSVGVIHIDLQTALPDSAALRDGLLCAIKEQYEEKYRFIAYRNGKRFLRVLKKADLPRTAGEPFIKQNGTYLLLGGTGGIGSYVSQYMVKRHNAKIILIGKSKINSEKQRQIDLLKRLGGEVAYYEADLNDIDYSLKVIKNICRNHGEIDGVINLAAFVENCLLRDMTPEVYHRVVGNQVLCGMLLKEMYVSLRIKNYIIFSSASSFFGSKGGSNYSASKSFMDAFGAFLGGQESVKVQVLNWGLWGQVGLGKTYEKTLQQKFRSVIPIQPKDGIKALHKILQTNIMQVIPITSSETFLKSETDYFGQRKSNKENDSHKNQPLMGNEKIEQTTIKEGLVSLLKKIIGNNLKLDPASIHEKVHLGDYGMDSIVGVNILKDLENLIGSLPATLMYEFFTINALADYLLKEHGSKVEEILQSASSSNGSKENEGKTPETVENPNTCHKSAASVACMRKSIDTPNKTCTVKVNQPQKTDELPRKSQDIAIIGVNGIYPKAKNLKEFWKNLIDKVDCISYVPEDRWDYKAYEQNSTIYGKWGGFIDDVEMFDPLFFNISPKEAKAIDPQERLFLQVAYNTFVDAGYSKEDLNNQKVGVFAGVTANTYQFIGLENWNNASNNDIPNCQSWSISNRVSFTFNLRGPSIPVDTACSSSLSAIHFACQSILNGESDMALAGGVNLYLHPYKYAGLCQLNMLSPTGKCRTFNNEADGFVPGEGVGTVLLKPLDKAIKDGDHIYCVVKATSVNHGGRTNGYSVPNPNAQAELIESALNKAGINPRTISYMEAHGTGTVLGDPIEISGLTMAFKKYTQEKQFCAIGSVKTNIGHLESASGIVGLTKILLQMKYKKIAPSLYTEPVNSRINIKESPFYLVPEVIEWQRPKVIENGEEIIYPRRAGISAFGAGGANAHVIIEEFLPEEGENMGDEVNIAVLSAKTEEQLKSLGKDLLKDIKSNQYPGNSDYTLRNMAYTLQTGRDEMEERLAIVVTSLDDLVEKLKQFIDGIKSGNGIYFGAVNKSIADRGQLKDLADAADLSELAKAWIEGYKIHWRTLYNGTKPRKLPLPLYPFQQKSLWLSKVKPQEVKIQSSVSQKQHSITQTVCEETRVDKVLMPVQDETTTIGMLMQELKNKVCSILELSQDEVNDDTVLGEYGFDSLTFSDFADVINKDYGLNISPAIFFEYANVRELASYLSDKFKVEPAAKAAEQNYSVSDIESSMEKNTPEVALPHCIHENTEVAGFTSNSCMTQYEEDNDCPVAIVGMAGLMPQCDDLDEFWENLYNGKDMVTEVPLERWDWRQYYGDPIMQKNKTMAKWGGFIKDADKFDARFFGIAVREAELMDPQQRIMLELAWHTVENAGYSVASLSGSNTGVFIGAAANVEYNDLLSRHLTEMEAYQTTGVSITFLANRISYLFNLNGPSEPIDTACSSTLVAIHRAIESIRNGDCEMAFAGGANLILTPRGAISFSKSGMLSADGRCKTFDKDANGYVRSEGMGMVLLKPLKLAQQSGDHIYAVIKGSAVNHGGKGNSITSPNPNAQAEVIIKAYEKAKVDIETIRYIETHGTGTQLGDPIEINGLKKAFETLAKRQGKESIPVSFCGLGTVKSNVGHLEAGAGIASLFKVLLSFKHGIIPANLHFKELNPNIVLEGSPFYIVDQKQPFDDSQSSPFRAGISSFGIGGVNSHILVEEYVDNKPAVISEGGPYLIVISAKDKDRLILKAMQLAEFLSRRFQACETDSASLSSIEQQVANDIGDILGMLPEDIVPELPFADIGLDKVTLSELCGRIKSRFGLQMRIDQVVEKATTSNLCKYLEEMTSNSKDISNDEGYLHSLAYTLQIGRDEMEERACWIVSNISELIKGLKEFHKSNTTQYCRRVRKKDAIEFEDYQGILPKALREKDYTVLADFWLRGAKINWKVLYGEEVVPRLELPVYPFYRNRYWFDDSTASEEPMEITKTVPLIQVTKADRKGFQYMIDLDDLYTLLSDHVVDEKVILPGAFYFELISSVVEKEYDKKLGFEMVNAFWSVPYIFQGELGNKLYISIEQEESIKLKVSSVDENKMQEHFVTNVRLDVNKPQEGRISVKDIEARCHKQISHNDFYSVFKEHGFDYGVGFQTVSGLCHNGSEVLTHLQQIDSAIEKCNFHPSMIDGAFQSVGGVGNTQTSESNSKIYLPFYVKSFYAYGPIPKSC
ncbi:MAG TPA: SDR family NAD(P)-dependent oxidoreductase, partial [Ruminiclostridium sp.]|nr:SDR family NAD(P)-dependent oxidoreductase [Ruminiclostridium sp.]